MGRPVGAVPKRDENAYAKALFELLTPRYDDSWVGWFTRVTSEKFINSAWVVAWHMVNGQYKRSYKDWRAAAEGTGRGFHLFQLLQKEMQGPVGAAVQEMVSRNATLISSIPVSVRDQVAQEIAKAQQAGARPEAIARLLDGRITLAKHKLRTRARLIARTETAKASLALTEARSQSLGLRFYVWLTSEDQRVRLSHKKMDGVVVPWDEPPAPDLMWPEPGSKTRSKLGHYHAGGAPNCRCTQEVVLSLDDIQWPARVYHAGKVERYTRARFQQVFGATVERPQAAAD